MNRILIMRFLLYCVSILILSACSTSQDEVYQDNSHPYGDISEGFMTQEGRTYRDSEPPPEAFFFRSCSQTDRGTHYSKTSYMCDDR